MGLDTREQFAPGLKYLVGKIYCQLTLRCSNIGNNDPIVVYQMGKVGSKTVVESLKSSTLRRPIYHVHYITKEGLDYHKDMSLNPQRPKLGIHHWTGHYLRKKIEREKRVWNVITLVREPISRNISAFFHVIDTWIPDFDPRFFDKIPSMSVEQMRQLFLEKYPHDLPTTWFDTEMKVVFGIDVFASQFPKYKGYKIYRGERANLLLIRLEDFNSVIGEALSEFLCLNEFKMVRANIGSEGRNAANYRLFLDHVVLPEEYIQDAYTSKYVQHFYTDSEVLKFSSRWSGKSIGKKHAIRMFI